jgi:hypothetical protein
MRELFNRSLSKLNTSKQGKTIVLATAEDQAMKDQLAGLYKNILSPTNADLMGNIKSLKRHTSMDFNPQKDISILTNKMGDFKPFKESYIHHMPKLTSASKLYIDRIIGDKKKKDKQSMPGQLFKNPQPNTQPNPVAH